MKTITMYQVIQQFMTGQSTFEDYLITDERNEDGDLWEDYIDDNELRPRERNILRFNKCKFDFEFNFYISTKIEEIKFFECEFRYEMEIFSDLNEIGFYRCTFNEDVDFGTHNIAKFFNVGNNYKKDFICQSDSINIWKFIFDNCKIEQVGYFRNLNFGKESRFLNCDLSNCSFTGSNVEGAQFINCVFNFNKLIDEKFLKEDKKDLNLVISLYRSFEIVFDAQKDFQYSGEFHKKRFELDRSFTKKSLKKTLLDLYKFSSDYGENYQKSLFWFLGSFSIFSILYLFSGLNFTDHNGTVTIFYLKAVNQFNIWNDLGLSAIYSLNNVIPFKKDLDYLKAANGWTTLFTILESFILTILASLFVIGLRRKFKR